MLLSASAEKSHAMLAIPLAAAGRQSVDGCGFVADRNIMKTTRRAALQGAAAMLVPAQDAASPPRSAGDLVALFTRRRALTSAHRHAAARLDATTLRQQQPGHDRRGFAARLRVLQVAEETGAARVDAIEEEILACPAANLAELLLKLRFCAREHGYLRGASHRNDEAGFEERLMISIINELEKLATRFTWESEGA
jgi:hypothetical protein